MGSHEHWKDLRQLCRTGEAGGSDPHNDYLLRPMAVRAVQTKMERSQGSIRMGLWFRTDLTPDMSQVSSLDKQMLTGPSLCLQRG